MSPVLSDAPVQTIHWPSVIRHYRLSKGLKQAALADDLGVTQTMVSRWESGAALPSRRIQDRVFDLYWASHASVPRQAWMDRIGRHPSLVSVIAADGRILRVSRGFLRSLECERGQLEGRYLSDAFEGDFVTVHEALCASGFFEGRVSSAESMDRYVFIAPGGQHRSFLGHGLHRPAFLPGPKIVWLASGAEVSRGVFRDVRERLGGPLVIRRAL